MRDEVAKNEIPVEPDPSHLWIIMTEKRISAYGTYHHCLSVGNLFYERYSLRVHPSRYVSKPKHESFVTRRLLHKQL